MSNPFATFRKNQKFWMAALVLLAILAFVVYPVFDYASRAIQGGGDSGTVVVRWDGGKVTMADLRNSTEKHSSLVRFLGALAQEVVDAGGLPQVPGFEYDAQQKQIRGLGIQTSNNEVDVCRTRILATHGRSLGIEFSDTTIDEFIRSFCDGKVSTARLEELLSETTGGRLSWFEAREMLKEELSAMVVGQIARTGIYSQSPGKTYRDFLKLTQTANVEAFPVFVDDYLDKVTSNPTEAEIQAIYEAGMSQPANANSPEPGFLRRYQANLQYVEASLQTWIDREKEKLTEEQLRAEYDRRVQLGQLQVPVTDATSTEDSAASSSAAEGTSPDGDAESTEAASGSETQAPETTEGANEPTEGDPASQPPAESTEEQPAGETPNAEDQTSQLSSATRLVSFLPQDEEQAGDAPAVPPPVIQPPPLNAGSASGGSDTASSEDGAPKMRTQTFEEAKDFIADSLARDVAIPALDEALTKLLEDVMKPYYGSYRQYQAFMESGLDEDEDGNQRKLPARPDLKKLAEQHGLVFNETGLVDGVKIAQTPFGLGNIRPNETGITGSVANVAMNPGLSLFQPMQSSYFDQAALMQGQAPEFLQYLFWKTEERPAYIPKLEEVREEVVDAWKRQKARQFAETAASELAKKVGGNAEDPWADALTTAEKALIIETDPFSWLTRFGEFTMTSNVSKLDAVGGEFMQKVFSTPAGQVSVGPNASRNVYYVFRVVEYSPGDEELQQRFNADPIKSGPMEVAAQERDRMVVDWYENLERELNVQWQMNVSQF